MTFTERLQAAWGQNRSLLCVGLDTDPTRIPAHLLDRDYPIFEFNKAIVDATADLVCAYKPQIAFYAACGAEDQLTMTVDYIHEAYPGLLVVLDAKRGDIGSTAEMYAREAFERYNADAVTVNPYLGEDSLAPFLAYENRGVIVLCRTSNASARDFQDLDVGDGPLYMAVARRVASQWNGAGNAMLVVGATYPDEMRQIRRIVGDVPMLVPGIGAQGGDVEAVLECGLDSQGRGLVISSSRGIIYAGAGPAFADGARAAAQSLHEAISAFDRESRAV